MNMQEFLAGLLVVFSTWGLRAGELPIEDGWSKPVNGLQARVVFGEGKMFSGNRYALVYLELHNAANLDSPLEFHYDAEKSLHLDLRTADGKPLSRKVTSLEAISRIGHDVFHLSLPMDATLRFPITTGGGFSTSSNRGVIFDFESNNFIVPYGDPAEYFLSVTLEVPVEKRNEHSSSNGYAWLGKLTAPPMKIPPTPAKPPVE